MIQRHLQTRLLEAASKYPVAAVTGPRQSGKTTLCQYALPDYTYVNLEKPDIRRYAAEDPNDFLRIYRNYVIFDEVQRVPELFSYLMPMVDEDPRAGRFILTGSQNFLLMESVSQSLAGRVAILHLMPFALRELLERAPLDVQTFSIAEMEGVKEAPDVWEHLFTGGFPPIHDRGHEPGDWMAQYTQTYLERDVRSLINVGDLESFERFLRLCAGRTAQTLNYAALASDTGVSVPTAKRWLSVLKASFLVRVLPPHHRNFRKRLTKSPKMHFTDSGLLCYLLGIRSAEELAFHSCRGAIFESYVVSAISKAFLHRGIEPPLFYWRDSTGREVDLIVEQGEKPIPFEIKSGATFNPDMIQDIAWWCGLAGSEAGALVYAGDDEQYRRGIRVLPWHAV